MRIDSVSPQSSSTRAAERIRSVLVAAEEPMTSARIAEQTGLAPSVVRHHLRLMRAAGTAYEVPSEEPIVGRGRPAHAWRARIGPDPRLLAQLATELATALHTPVEDASLAQRLRSFGEIASSQSRGRGAVDTLIDGLRRLGFQPHVISEVGPRRCIALDSCPFIDPGIGVTNDGICRAHALLAEGMAGSDTRIELLEVSRTGIGCRLHVVDAGAAADSAPSTPRIVWRDVDPDVDDDVDADPGSRSAPP